MRSVFKWTIVGTLILCLLLVTIGTALWFLPIGNGPSQNVDTMVSSQVWRALGSKQIPDVVLKPSFDMLGARETSTRYDRERNVTVAVYEFRSALAARLVGSVGAPCIGQCGEDADRLVTVPVASEADWSTARCAPTESRGGLRVGDADCWQMDFIGIYDQYLIWIHYSADTCAELEALCGRDGDGMQSLVDILERNLTAA